MSVKRRNNRKQASSTRNGLLKARKYFISRIEDPDSVKNKKPGGIWKDIVKEYPFLSKQGTIMKIQFLEEMLSRGGNKVNPYHITKGASLLRDRREIMESLGISEGSMLFVDDDKISGPLLDLVSIEDRMNEIGFPVERVTERFTIKSGKVARVYKTYYGGLYQDVAITNVSDVSPFSMKRMLADSGLNGYSHYAILKTDSDGKPVFDGLMAGVMFMDIFVTVNRHGLVVNEEMPIDFMMDGDEIMSIKRIKHSMNNYDKAIIVEAGDWFNLYIKMVNTSPGQWIREKFPSIDAAGPSLESYFGEYNIVDI